MGKVKKILILGLICLTICCLIVLLLPSSTIENMPTTTPAVTSTSTRTPYPTIGPTSTPTLLPESMVSITFTLKPGDYKCADLGTFTSTFIQSLIDQVGERAPTTSINYWTEEHYESWPPYIKFPSDQDLCPKYGYRSILVAKNTPPGIYDLKFDFDAYSSDFISYRNRATLYIRIEVIAPTP